jgi:hydrogenase/urease accessory protein HupE
MAGAIYVGCILTSALCAWLLLQAWRRGRYRLLLWSGLCFVGLAANNLMLLLDKLVFPGQDLAILRSATALAAMLVLLYGLINDAE